MRGLIILIILVVAQGFMWRTVDKYDMLALHIICKDKGGVNEIKIVMYNGEVTGKCDNGMLIDNENITYMSYEILKYLVHKDKRGE